MAEKQVGGLSLRIGLTLSQLQSDFLAAEQTVKQGIAALNRQQNIVKLKMETDVTGLDAVADKTKILEVQERGLTQLLEMQRDRLTLATKAYQEYANTKGANETVANKLETSMERERLAVARLEAQLKSLAAQKVSLDTSQLQDNIARLNARIQNIKISAEIDTSKLEAAGRIFDVQKTHVAALTQELELQRQKLAQLREAMYRAAQAGGADSVHTLQVKTNVLQQIQQINQLEAKLKELSTTDVKLKIRAESLKQAEVAIQENIARLNAKIDHIKVKTDIDVSKISGAVSEFDKAKLHAQGLTRELDLQNQKLAEMKRALSTSINTSGLTSVKTINLQTEIQKQIQAIDQLKTKIQELNNIQPPKKGLLDGYLSIKGDVAAQLNNIATAFSNLRGATSSADSAIVSVLGVIDTIPTPVGKAAVALVGLPLIFKGIENSIVDMMKATAAAGDATYVMSRGFQMSLAETGKFTSMCKVAGADVNDLASTIKRVQQAIVRGGEDAKGEQWLKRYGESAFDASGHLKNLNDMTLTLSRALKRAQADGNGMAFILGTMRSASADAITAIEDVEDNYKEVQTLVKTGLLDPTLAHSVQGKLNKLQHQTDLAGASFKGAFLPVADEIVPRLTERMSRLAQVIADNKDTIREFGRAAAEAFIKVEGAAEFIGGAVARVGKFFVDLKKKPRQDELVLKYQNDLSIESVDDLIKKEQSKAFNVIKDNPRLYQQVLSIYQPIFKAIDDAHEEIKRKNEELQKNLAAPLSVAVDLSLERQALEDNPELLKTSRKARKYAEEAGTILAKLSSSDYESKKIDLMQWRTELLRETELSAEEREAIERLYSAKLAQIQKEHADQIKQYWQNAADIQYELTHTAFEKQLRDIELWKEAKIKAGEETSAIIANAAAKEAEAFEREVDRIKGKVQSLEDKIFEQEHSQYEADLHKLQQERIRLYEEGANSPEQIERYYQNALNKLKIRAAESSEKGGDYTKAPEGTLQRGGNNIVVIGADQIIDDGLKRANIGVMVDENRIRAQVSQGLSQQAKDLINATQATRDLTDAQKQLVQQASGFQLIEGDKVAFDMPQPSGFEQINGDQIVTELQQFGDALQQTTTSLEQSEPAQKIAQAESALAETLNQAATDFPADYFKTLADNMKGVSDVMVSFTNDLIDAHGRLKNALSNTLQANAQMQTGGLQQLPTDSFQRLSTSTQDLSDAQDLLARKTRELESEANDLKLGFDWDVFGGVGTAALAGLEFLTAIGSVAPHPGAKLLALGGAAGIAALTGSYDATTERPDERLKPYIETDLSGLIEPLTAIDQKFDSLLQKLQAETADNSFAHLGDILSEKLGALPNIERYAQEISQSVQTIELPTDTIVTPLNNINGIVAQILSALQNREPPSITVSPNIDVNLGGAYVFDDALKKALVGDITSDVVISIKDAVQQATSKSSYGYGA